VPFFVVFVLGWSDLAQTFGIPAGKTSIYTSLYLGRVTSIPDITHLLRPENFTHCL
jgi:hypothetical protein